MKKNKLSASALNQYLTCGAKYDFHYNKKLRSKVISGALLFGGAVDKALNDLLLNKNLESAKKIFDQEWENNWINKKKVYLPTSELIVYAKKDFDHELLTKEDKLVLDDGKHSNLDAGELISEILKKKEESGFENLPGEDKQFYNLANWLCLKNKGYLMLEAYNKIVLPKIKTVLAVQKEFNLEGKTGDIIPGWIDLIVEFHDGKLYIMDNKTSSMEYEQDSAKKSKQLILYYYVENKERAAKNEKLLDGAGFFVMYKQIDKNRIKICEKCGYNGTGGRHKTCDKMIRGGDEEQRCNGKWIETIKPECRIDIILNEIPQTAQNLIIKSFKAANDGIKKEVFVPNPDACENYGQRCPYYNLCWKGKDEELITLSEKK